MHSRTVIIICDSPAFAPTLPRRPITAVIGSPLCALALRGALVGLLRIDIDRPPEKDIGDTLKELAAEISMADVAECPDLKTGDQPFWREIGQNSKRARREFQSKIKPTPRR